MNQTNSMTPSVESTDNIQREPSDSASGSFVERRVGATRRRTPGIERRQFSNSYGDLSPEAAELGRAIDAYKLDHHRRFVNFEEILAVIKSLGYRKSDAE